MLTRDFAAAEPDLTAAVTLLPNSYMANAYLGHMRRRQVRWVEAAGLLERAAAIEPGDVNTLWSLMHIYGAMRQREPMERAALRARAANPKSTWPALVQSLVLWKFDGDLAGFLATLEPIYAQSPDDSIVAFHLVRGLMSQGRFQEAIAMTEPLREDEIEIIGGWHAMEIGWAYRESGDLSAANRWFEVSLSETDTDALQRMTRNLAALATVFRAYSLAGIGRNDEAVASVRTALEMVPRSTDEVGWAFVAFEAASLRGLIGDTQGALELVRQLLEPPSVYFPYQIWFHWPAAPLRANPEFRELMARHGVDVTRDPRAEYAAQQTATQP